MAGSEPSRRFTQSLMGKLVLTGMVPAVLVILTLAGINGYRRYHLLLDAAEFKLATEAQTIAAAIETSNIRSVDLARTISLAQSDGMFGQRQRTMEFLKHALEEYPEINGTYVAYEPNADGQDATARIPGATLTADMRDAFGKPEVVGRYVPYYFRDRAHGGAISLKPGRQMEVNDYYQVPLKNWRERQKAEILVTEPYDYEGEYIVEATWPIVRDGQFVGIGGVDRSLKAFQAMVLARARETGSDIFVVSPGERIIVATDGSGADYSRTGDPDDLFGKPFEKTAYATLFKSFVHDTRPAFSMAGVNPGTGDGTGEDPGTPAFFASAKVDTGKWRVIMAVPQWAVTGPIWLDIGVTAAIAAVGITVIVIILWKPAKQIARRIDQAAAAAQQVAAGDLTRPPSCADCPDETGELLRALDSMTGDLNTLVGQVRTASIQLNTVATQLGTTSRQQEEVAASFGASSSEIAAAVREITTTGQELAREMVHVSESASATAQLAKEGSTQLETMEGAMQSLDQATGGVADRLAAINEKAVNITGVVVTITKVAEQTNLLSVNAAIEAEKAGEYGRGFLVVAREIRRLADQTAQSTLDIERMVKEMQAAVSSGVMEMDRFSDQVRRNVSDVRGIGRSMQEIIVRVDEGTNSFGTVREGMQSQAAGAAQISEAMASLSSNAKATTESVREFGKAAEELQKSIGSLKAAIAAFHLRN